MNRSSLIHRINSCIQYGDVTLHSGQRSNWLCDILLLRPHFNEFLWELCPEYALIGIELGGCLLVAHWSRFYGIVRKSGEVYLPYKDVKDVTLVDDVVTTENSMISAEQKLNEKGVIVKERLCILDRRIDKKLDIRSICTPNDLNIIDFTRSTRK